MSPLTRVLAPVVVREFDGQTVRPQQVVRVSELKAYLLAADGDDPKVVLLDLLAQLTDSG